MKEISPVAEERLVEALRRGVPLSAAAPLCGLTVGQVRAALDAGTPDALTGQVQNTKMQRFTERCMQAWAEAEQDALDAIMSAAKGWDEETLERRVLRDANNDVRGSVERKTVKRVRSWQAAAWYLERARRERYGREADAPVVDSQPVKRIVLASPPAHLPMDKSVSTNGNGVHHLNGLPSPHGNGKH